MTTRYSARRMFVRRAAILGTLAALALVAAWKCELSPDLFLKGFGKSGEFLGEFFPPMWSAWDEILEAVGLTLVLAAAATLIGFLLCFPVALAAANNLAPPWLREPMRMLIRIERALPEILALLFFVRAFGIGPFAGIIALAGSSVGSLGKLLADAIEEADPLVLESVTATGATRWQTIRYAVIPEVFPALASNTIFRFDQNVRSTVVLGAVGAGGVGAEIFRSMGMLLYSRATLAVLGSLLLIAASERVSTWLRAKLLEAGKR
jgi:phosphonate transport system permease protein